MAKTHTLKEATCHQMHLPGTTITGQADELHRRIQETRRNNRIARGKKFSGKAHRTHRIIKTKRPNYGDLLKHELKQENH